VKIVQDLAFMQQELRRKKNGEKWLGPTWDQLVRISVLSGSSSEAAEHEIRQAILSEDVAAVWHDKCGEFHLTVAETSS
jgi:hypothetical protein